MYRLIAEHADFVVVDKPPGVSVHKDQQQAGLVMLLSEQLGQPLYLVHRLDKVTSGLLLLAKNARAAAELGELFAKREIAKYYLAVLETKPKKKQGSICGDMTKSRRGTWKLLHSRENPAITRFVSCALKAGGRLCLVKPETGKTHQIRVALKSLGAAILGDPLYSANGASSDRCYLHAWQLLFSYQGQTLRYTSPPSWGERFAEQDLQQQLLTWQQPERLSWPGQGN